MPEPVAAAASSTANPLYAPEVEAIVVAGANDGTITNNYSSKDAYLTDVLTRLVHGHQQSRLSELTPWAWKAAKAAARAVAPSEAPE